LFVAIYCNLFSFEIIKALYQIIYETKKGVTAMPIYEYKCKECKKEFEKLVFAGDDKQITCPKCKSMKVAKKMSATSFMGNSSLGKCATGAPGAGFS
jgi:putative FmdB family regulatory protein